MPRKIRIMKHIQLATAILFGLTLSSLADTPTITGVTARQRYPWNGKVDITYTVTGDIEAEAEAHGMSQVSIKVTATDRSTGNSYTAASLMGDMGLSAGTHALVWDMNADGLSFVSDDVVFDVSCEAALCSYLVVDLSTGASASFYPVTWLVESPIGGFNTDEYKTTKLVLRRIEPGSIPTRNATITKPFFVGFFEVTQKQYSLVLGSNPSSSLGNTRPVERVSYNAIRGESLGSQWPASNVVDSDSFLGRLRARTSLDFDLPTEAQWEYACRAGTTTTYHYGNYADGNYMWYRSNSSDTAHEVGTKLPNAWGLFDMHGNRWEWCLDWYADESLEGADPVGASSGTARVRRGGGSNNAGKECASNERSHDPPSNGNYDSGFRLVLTLAD